MNGKTTYCYDWTGNRKRASLLLSFFFFLLSSFFFTHHPSFSQNLDIINLQPDSAVAGIQVKKISSDNNSSSFIIWIKDGVKAHKHEKHTENIYVLEGEGEMKINGKSIKIKPGYYVNIPGNTVHSLKVTSAVPVKVLSVQSPEFLGDDRIWVEE